MSSGSQSGVIASVNHHCCSTGPHPQHRGVPSCLCVVLVPWDYDQHTKWCAKNQQRRSCELPVATAALFGSVEMFSENFFILPSPSHFVLPLLLLDLEPWALKMSAFRSTHSNSNNLSILVLHVGEILGAGSGG